MKKTFINASPTKSRFRGDGGPPLNQRKPIPVQIIGNSSSEPKDLGFILSRNNSIIGSVFLTSINNSLVRTAIFSDGRKIEGYSGEYVPKEEYIKRELNITPVRPIQAKSNFQTKETETESREESQEDRLAKIYENIDRYENQLRQLKYLTY